MPPGLRVQSNQWASHANKVCSQHTVRLHRGASAKACVIFMKMNCLFTYPHWTGRLLVIALLVLPRTQRRKTRKHVGSAYIRCLHKTDWLRLTRTGRYSNADRTSSASFSLPPLGTVLSCWPQKRNSSFALKITEGTARVRQSLVPIHWQLKKLTLNYLILDARFGRVYFFPKSR